MAGYMVNSGNYRIEGIGIVHVLLKSGAKNIRARWKGTILQVSAPRGIEYDRFREVLLDLMPRLEQKKPEALYRLDMKLEFPDFSVSIKAQHHAPDRMFIDIKYPESTIYIGSNWNMESPDTIKNISKFICRLAQIQAEPILLPQAHTVSQRLGVSPLSWSVSNGHRTLGLCNAKGEIALSYALMFYPYHLREFVICHELAHLSELNHSPRFHEICNIYCQGREQELSEELKRTPFPLPR